MTKFTATMMKMKMIKEMIIPKVMMTILVVATKDGDDKTVTATTTVMTLILIAIAVR